MKKKLMLTVLFCIMLPIIAGGCFSNIWRVSFGFLENYDDWTFSQVGDCWDHIPGLGVRLDGCTMSSPVSFTGDFTMSVLFTLNTDEIKKVYFGFYPGDSSDWPPDNAISSFFADVGLKAEDWWVDDIGATSANILSIEDTELPSLLRKGPNVWKMVKTGNQIKIFVNFYKLADFTITRCEAASYKVAFYSEVSGGGDIVFNSATVRYKGSIL